MDEDLVAMLADLPGSMASVAWGSYRARGPFRRYHAGVDDGAGGSIQLQFIDLRVPTAELPGIARQASVSLTVDDEAAATFTVREVARLEDGAVTQLTLVEA